MISFILKEAVKGLNRKRSQFFLGTGVQAICLLLFTLFFLITINIAEVMRHARRRIEIFAFLDTLAQETTLKEKILMIKGVKDVRYVSRGAALKELEEDLGEARSVIDVLGKNPIPASFRISLEPKSQIVERLKEIESKIQSLSGIREVWSGKEILVKLEKITRIIIVIDFALLIIISLSVIYISFQTVESTILLWQKEIEIMRLVGAGLRVIKGPFLLQGLLQGLFGGLIAFAISYIIYWVTILEIPSPLFPTYLVLGLNLIAGGLLGMVGSNIALNKVLR